MALPKDEVIKIAKGFLELIRQKHDVRQAYLFGSFVNEAAKDYSDEEMQSAKRAIARIRRELDPVWKCVTYYCY